MTTSINSPPDTQPAQTAKPNELKVPLPLLDLGKVVLFYSIINKTINYGQYFMYFPSESTLMYSFLIKAFICSSKWESVREKWEDRASLVFWKSTVFGNSLSLLLMRTRWRVINRLVERPNFRRSQLILFRYPFRAANDKSRRGGNESKAVSLI